MKDLPHVLLDALEWADAIITEAGLDQNNENYEIVNRALKAARHALPHDHKPWETREKAIVQCARCNSTGEVIARSRHVGGEAVNDDYDTCPACGGNGYVMRSAA